MIAITTADRITHYLESPEEIATYSSSPATVAALQVAYDAGDWEPYIPVIVEMSEPTATDWDSFNAAIMGDPRLNAVMGSVLTQAPAIALGIPAALAQVSQNGPEAFALVFDALCTLGGATQDDRNAWAALAETYNLPADFVSIVRG